MGGPGEELIEPQAAIETERLLLEPVMPAHAAGIFEAVTSSLDALLPWMPWAKEPTLEKVGEQAARSRRDWMNGTHFHFAMIERETGMVLGVAGLNAGASDAPELHYWIRTDHSRRGLTTEACRGLIEWARRTLHVHRLMLWAGRDNAASRRVAEKLGFVHIGPLGWKPEGGLGTFEAESYELTL
jgi:RimJ/RimL family protein N-acetyltransferase